MRKELEPNLIVGKKVFPKIIKLIDEFNNGDGDEEKYEILINEISKITGKEFSQFMNYDNYIHGMYEPGPDGVAFQFALPSPIIVNDISKDELTEIVKRITVDRFKQEENDEFLKEIKFDLWGYYYTLIEKNYGVQFREYIYGKIDESGEYKGEYEIEEIVDDILNNQITKTTSHNKR